MKKHESILFLAIGLLLTLIGYCGLTSLMQISKAQTIYDNELKHAQTFDEQKQAYNRYLNAIK